MSSVFKIYSPEDCDFYYDGELQGHIDGNSDRAFRFEVERKGAYRLKFVNSEYKSELIVKVSIDADEEREVELDFSEVNEPVIRRITTAIEHNYGQEERLSDEIISLISKDGIAIIPKGVRKIGACAFKGCSSLTSITIPDSVKEIGVRAFAGCSSLTSITIPKGIKEIRIGMFAGCYSLTSIIIPDSIIAIGAGAFFSCSSLTTITIPNNVIEIVQDAFWHCSSLTAIYCKATTPPQLLPSPTIASIKFKEKGCKIYVPKSARSTVLEAYTSALDWRGYADSIEEYDFDNE